jgi:hypothetical protein
VPSSDEPTKEFEMAREFDRAAAALSRNTEHVSSDALDALADYRREERARVADGGRGTFGEFLGALGDAALLNLCARTNAVSVTAGELHKASPGSAKAAVSVAVARIADIAADTAQKAGDYTEKRLDSLIRAMGHLTSAAAEADPGGPSREAAIDRFVAALYSGPKDRHAFVEKALASTYAAMSLDQVAPFLSRLDAHDFRAAVNGRSAALSRDGRPGSGTAFEAALSDAVVEYAAASARTQLDGLPGHAISRRELSDGAFCEVVKQGAYIGLDPRIGPAVVKRGRDGAVEQSFLWNGEKLGRTREEAIENFRDMFPGGLPPLPAGFEHMDEEPTLSGPAPR